MTCQCKRHELNTGEDALSKSEALRAEPFVVNYVSCRSASRGAASQPRVVCECRRHELNTVEDALSKRGARRAEPFVANYL